MKVLLVNRSGHAKGCTYTALEEVAGALEKNGIETEIIQVGTQPIAGCIGCNACLKNGKCFREDGVNEFVEKAKTADGFVFGSPVHYASASGMITSWTEHFTARAPCSRASPVPASSAADAVGLPQPLTS